MWNHLTNKPNVDLLDSPSGSAYRGMSSDLVPNIKKKKKNVLYQVLQYVNHLYSLNVIYIKHVPYNKDKDELKNSRESMRFDPEKGKLKLGSYLVKK